MSETKIEWVVQTRNNRGAFVDGGIFDHLDEAQEELKDVEESYLVKHPQIIKRTTVTTEEIVK